jgi:hypothetical protein
MHGMQKCMHARGTQHAAPGIDNGARRLRSHVLLEIQFKQLRKQGELVPNAIQQLLNQGCVVQVISVVATTAASLCQWPLGE